MKLNFTYLTQHMQATALPLLLFLVFPFFKLFSQTTISGGNVAGVWDLNGSPYYLLGDVTIPPGSTLLIQPGVTLQGDQDVDFIVQGRLIATGTPDSIIYFTASDTLVGWGGLEFHSTVTGDTELQYAKIDYALAGLYFSSNPTITLSHLEIKDNTTGIFAQYCSETQILSNVEVYNNENGLYAYGPFPSEFNSCQFHHNLDFGVFLEEHVGCLDCDFLVFNNCQFFKNGRGFVTETYRRKPSLINCTVTENINEEVRIIETNTGSSFSLVTIENSIIWGGTFEDGIVLEGSNINIEVSHSDVSLFSGIFPGTGNINDGPRFSDPGIYDFELQCTSPCINAGNPASSPDPDGTVADMGALWFDSSNLSGSASNNSPVCEGGEVLLMAGGGVAYEWSGANGFASTSQSPVLSSVTSDMSGEYSVTITTSDGCTIELSTEVAVNSLPIAGINGNLAFCEGESTTLTASGGASYEWSTGETTPSITITNEGDYTVTATDDNGCIDTNTVMVVVNGLPVVSLVLERDTFCIDETNIELTGGMPVGGNYSGPGITGNFFEPSIAGIGTHSITYTFENPEGCVNSTPQEVVVLEAGSCMTRINGIETGGSVKVFPNPSTGNFTIQLEGLNGKVDVQIFNVQGSVIYSKENRSNRIQISGIPKGAFWLKLSNEAFSTVRRLIVH